MSRNVAFAIAAHPDDIEFMMAGTMLLLAEQGYELHVMNLANGYCGSATMDREETIATRLEEARDAAKMMNAHFHPPLANDLEILYTLPLLKRLAAVIREVQPTVLLLHPPQDYMEDHMNACRLAVSAAFSRGMRNFETDPPREPVSGEVTLYHALPYGLMDGMRQKITPEFYVNIAPVLEKKREALACHRSQKEWLDHSQGLDSYLNTMEEMSRQVGQWSQAFQVAEGWRRHSHLGFCKADSDPIKDAIPEFVVRV